MNRLQNIYIEDISSTCKKVWIDVELRDALETIEGVAEVSRVDDIEKYVLVYLDPRYIYRDTLEAIYKLGDK